MSAFTLLVLSVVGAYIGYLAYLRRLDFLERYTPVERAWIRTRLDHLRLDRGELATALELFRLYQERGDRQRALQLFRDSQPKLGQDPAFRAVEQFALWGAQLEPRTPTTGDRQRLGLDRTAGTVRLQLKDLVAVDAVEVRDLDVELPISLGAGAPPVKVHSLEVVVPEERVRPALARFSGQMGGAFGNLGMRFTDGLLQVSGSAYHVPFRMSLTVRPAAAHLLVLRVPRALEVLGIPLIPASSLTEQLLKQVTTRFPRAVTLIDATTLLLDLTAFSPVPVELNLSAIVVRPGEMLIRCRAGQAAALDPMVLNLAQLPPPAKELPPPPDAYASALAGRDEAGALVAGGQLVSSGQRPDLRGELARLALRLARPEAALAMVRAPGPNAPELKVIEIQALLANSEPDAASRAAVALEEQLSSEQLVPSQAAQLVELTQLLVRTLGNLVAANRALAKLAALASHHPLPTGLLSDAAQLAWEAGHAPLCEELARRLVAQDPFSAAGLRLLGYATRAQRKPLAAYTAFQLAVWVDPGDRMAFREQEALHRDLEATFAASVPGPAPVSTVHAKEMTPLGELLRFLGPQLEWLMHRPAETPLPGGNQAIASRPSHPGLVSLATRISENLGLPLPTLIVDNAPGLGVEVIATDRPVVRVTAGCLELSREELGFALARSIWHAGRGDARFLLMGEREKRVLVEWIGFLRSGQALDPWPFSKMGTAAWFGALADSTVGRKLRRRWEWLFPRRAALTELLPRVSRASATWLARALPSTPRLADLDDWIQALDLSADRAGFYASGDIKSCVSGMLMLELRSAGFVDEVRERGLAWGISFLAQPALARRLRELAAYAVTPDALARRRYVPPS